MTPLDPQRADFGQHTHSLWRRRVLSILGERLIERGVVAIAAVAVPLVTWLLLHR
jgi:hypothetical protein